VKLFHMAVKLFHGAEKPLYMAVKLFHMAVKLFHIYGSETISCGRNPEAYIVLEMFHIKCDKIEKLVYLCMRLPKYCSCDLTF
jgi:hypothetical protein